MKFICKEFWSTVFKKQIDNLRTNHQGVYVLLDNRFKFICHMSNSKQYVDTMPKVVNKQGSQIARDVNCVLLIISLCLN